MRCCVRCSPISRSTSSPEVGSYRVSRFTFHVSRPISPNCQQPELGYTDRQYGETKTASRPERARGDGQDGGRALATGIVPHEWPSGKWNLRARPPSR